MNRDQATLKMKLMAVIFLFYVAKTQGEPSGTTSEPDAEMTTADFETTTSPIPTPTGNDGMSVMEAVTTPTTPGAPSNTTTPGQGAETVPTCTLIDTPATLRIAGESPCIATKINNQTIQFKSPNFPKNYTNSVECKAETSSDGPRTLEVTPKLFTVHESDKLIIKGPFGYKKRILNEDLNNSISLPSAYAKFEFTSSAKKNMKGFKVNIRSKANSCHRICSLEAGSTGLIMKGFYGADTYCEWWMEAPTGCFIRMEFAKFDVGPASSLGGPWSCKGDYVGVGRDGDPRYGRPNSKTFCGSALPNATRSVDNKINVLFNGREGGYNGFEINYTVVC